MKRILMAAALLVSFSFKAEAVCTVSSGTINLEIPSLGDTGAVWAACTRRNFISLSTNTLANGSTIQNATFGHISLVRISGTSTSGGIRVSSSVWLDSGTYLMIGGTATVAGNAFSVGTSTFVVSGGLVGIGTTAPAQALDVRGNIISAASVTASAFFGYGGSLVGIPSSGSIVGVYVAKAGGAMSGGLVMSGSSITLTGDGGTITSASSITANAFFGNGAGLTNVSEGNTFTSTKTFTNTVLFGAVSAASGLLIIKSTSATPTHPVFNAVDTGGTTLLRLQQNGRNGIDAIAPNSKLQIGEPLDANEGAFSNSLVVNAGNLASTLGTEVAAASFGVGHNNGGAVDYSWLGIRGYRVATGNDWTTSAIAIGMDVANSTRAGANIWLHPNGNIAIATSTIPSTTLEVSGSASFGFAAAKSTFSISGALFMASGSSITLSGVNGFINSGSSVNASAFFGHGAALTGIPSTASISGVYAPLAGATFTGASGITNAAFTATGVNGHIISAASITASAFFGYGGNLTGISTGESNTYTSTKTFTSLVKVSSLTTSATGAGIYSIISSSGIQVTQGGSIATSTGGITFPDGSVQTTAGGGAGFGGAYSVTMSSNSDFAITSTVWISVFNSTLTFTATGGHVLLGWSCPAIFDIGAGADMLRVGVLANGNYFDGQMGTGAGNGLAGIYTDAAATAYPSPGLAFTHLTSGTYTGTTSFSLIFKVGSGTATLLSATVPSACQFWAQEMK